jgi:hypothetical protein
LLLLGEGSGDRWAAGVAAGAPEGIRTPDLCLRRATNIRFFNRLEGFFSGRETAFTGMFRPVKRIAPGHA